MSGPPLPWARLLLLLFAEQKAVGIAARVTSPSNTFDELARKTRQYLDAGSRSVWILVSAMREIHVHTAGAHPRILSAEDSLEDPALLPGFSARVWRTCSKSNLKFTPNS